MNAALATLPAPAEEQKEPEARRLSPTEVDLKATQRMMLRLARGGSIDRVGSMTVEHLLTGGKRLRARLALAASFALGVSRENAIAWASAVELLHNATLVHDDIQDGDRVRRGEPTTWAKHGIAQAINCGDLLLMLPFLAVQEVHDFEARAKLSALIAEYAARIVRGQAEEMSLLEAGRLDETSYFHAAAGKTGGLFALPIVGAAVMAGVREEDASELGQALEKLGVLFQIQDDVLDLFGDKGRGMMGADIYEGKVSALIVAAVHLHPALRTELLELLRRPRELKSRVDVDWARDTFVKSGALHAVMRRILELKHEVIGSEVWNQAPQLRPIAEKVIHQSLKPIHHLSETEGETA